jgi:hypothetical protein
MGVFRGLQWLAVFLAIVIAVSMALPDIAAAANWKTRVVKAALACYTAGRLAASIGCRFGPQVCIGSALVGCGVGGLISIW